MQFLLIFFGFSFFSSCSVGSAHKVTEINLVNWNVQTFFDGETAGNEYAEFKAKDSDSQWTREKYLQRVKRLCESVKAFDADILAFEEIENEAVIYDICNELNAHLPQNKLYPYACFARQEPASIGCAVLSRFPITGMSVHQCDFWDSSQTHDVPLMRPLMEVALRVNAGKDEESDVKIFVNHWKSKSGGEDVAALWQKYQESVLSERIALAKDDFAVISCGDFNREAAEFMSFEEKAFFRNTETDAAQEMDSGWFKFPEDETGEGSYFYKNEWERIDHVFVGGSARFVSFRALTDGAWTKEHESFRIPFRYTMATGTGYSDHLPVKAVISLE